mgnify:CR=1 FL=1
MSDTPPTSPSAAKAALRGSFMAAIFLMATSAIGPGFITQTATFTAKLGASFAFAILASILIDFVVQLNIWRITALTGKRASETANAAIPGAGYLLTALVVIGGLASVDRVTSFDDPTPIALIERLRPDVLIKGSDYTREGVVGGDLVESWGGEVKLADFKVVASILMPK